MQKTKDVGLVILGAGGYMGTNALDIVPELRRILAEREINLVLVCVAEANQQRQADVQNQIAEKAGGACEIFRLGSQAIGVALNWLDGSRTSRKALLVYDSTPAGFHYEHLYLVLP